MSAPDSLYQLVEKFDRDKERFTDPDYNEAQLREEFVNPFFRALGWDLGEQVLHEAGLRSGGTVKHPDYTFLAGSRRAFYVETKKPSINIGSSIEPAEQLRSYGWSGDTALGVLTNFAEFAVYDCRIEPVQGDLPEEARVMYLTSSQYLDEWDRLRETLSYEAVQQGKHGEILETTAKGVLRVDAAFLRDMEVWRADLAEHLHKQARFIHRTLSQRELNHLVQRTIDRIVFLRIAEDRNLESYGKLERAASVRRNVYNEIKQLYLAADKKYNSGLFHFDAADKTRPNPDTLSLKIYIVDNVLRKIIRDLYPPKSRYQFSVISADILGQVYERFLGKVIEVRSDGEKTEVTVEEKPEVRKAGGVYYTPGYIVDYIVENTVGKLVEDKSPAEVADLRIFDPACGSGSFLVGAYQYLLDWHLAYYRRHPKQFRNRRRETPAGMILTTVEKRRILLNNIYGVDLDQNAVEVSKLSLLLKMLENENEATGTSDMAEPILPDLSGNIKWGNSLIGSDFFSGQDMAALDDEELLRVKPFDWASKAGFGEIMAAGGFDAVIGNPPYRKERDSKELLEELRSSSYGQMYYEGKMDLWYFFLHRALDLVAKRGLISFIVSSYWIKSTGASRLINRLKSHAQFRNVVDFAKNKIFNDVGGNHMIFVLEKHTDNSDLTYLRFTQNGLSGNEIAHVLKEEDEDYVELQILSNRDIYTADGKINFHLAGNVGILDKLSRQSFHLQDQNKWFEVSQGVVEATDSVSPKSAVRTGRLQDTGKGIFVISGKEMQEKNFTQIERKFLKKYLRISDVGRYSYVHSEYYLLYIGNKENKHIKQNRGEYANLVTHLDYFAPYITSSNKPYGIHRTRKPHFFNREKLLCPNMFDKPNFTYCLEESYINLAFNVVISWQDAYSLKYVLGIMNSTLGAFWFNLLGKKRGVNVDIGVGVIRQFPIRIIDFADPDDLEMHDKMVALVEQMLDLHNQLPVLTAVQRGVVEQRIDAVDRGD